MSSIPSIWREEYGADQLRYFFLREVSFGQDGSYSHEAITGRINADLANDLGNLAQRSLSMIAKNCEGRVPACGPLTEADEALLAEADGLLGKARGAMGDFALHTVLADIWAVVAEANRYFAHRSPGSSRRPIPRAANTVLYVTAETIRQIAIPGPACHACRHGEDARSSRNCAGCARFCGPWSSRAARFRRHIASACAVFPRYVEKAAEGQGNQGQGNEGRGA